MLPVQFGDVITAAAVAFLDLFTCSKNLVTGFSFPDLSGV